MLSQPLQQKERWERMKEGEEGGFESGFINHHQRGRRGPSNRTGKKRRPEMALHPGPLDRGLERGERGKKREEGE
jgi:hypothetical protein